MKICRLGNDHLAKTTCYPYVITQAGHPPEKGREANSVDRKYLEEEIKRRKIILNNPNSSRREKKDAQAIIEMAEAKLRRLQGR